MLEAEEYIQNMYSWMWAHLDEDTLPDEFVNSYAAMSENQKIHGFMYLSGVVWGMMESSEDYDY